MDSFLKRMRVWLGRVEDFPLFGSLAEDLMTLLDLLLDYSKGIYHSLPRGTLVGICFALGYAMSPVDLILDIIPFAGFLDDAAILSILLEFGVARDLMHYRHWRSELRSLGLRTLRDNQVLAVLAELKDQCLAAPFLTAEKQLRLLVCSPEDRSLPLSCEELVMDAALEQLSALGVDSWENVGDFYTRVFQDPRLRWSCLGPRPFRPDYDPQVKTDEFSVKQEGENHGIPCQK